MPVPESRVHVYEHRYFHISDVAPDKVAVVEIHEGSENVECHDIGAIRRNFPMAWRIATSSRNSDAFSAATPTKAVQRSSVGNGNTGANRISDTLIMETRKSNAQRRGCEV